MLQDFPELLRWRLLLLRWSDPGQLYRRVSDRFVYSHVNEIETEHAREYVDQDTSNLGCIAAIPGIRKSEQADER